MDFAARDASPMLIGLEQPAFDDEDYIYEWKLDGVRCLLYLDKDSTELRNKRNLKLNAKFPELSQLHRQVKTRCILDGELYIFHNGEPDFFQVQKRTLTSDPFKIRLHSRQFPASFTAFDILYYKDAFVIDQPLMKRNSFDCLDGCLYSLVCACCVNNCVSILTLALVLHTLDVPNFRVTPTFNIPATPSSSLWTCPVCKTH